MLTSPGSGGIRVRLRLWLFVEASPSLSGTTGWLVWATLGRDLFLTLFQLLALSLQLPEAHSGRLCL